MDYRTVSRFTGVLFFALAGCATTEQARQALESQYLGKPVDAFFVRHGPPARQFATASGLVIYTWSSDPAGRTAGDRPLCEVQLTADQAGILKQIAPSFDSMGQWALSYCGELFK